MELISEPYGEFEYGILKNFTIEDKLYQETLNDLLSNIRMCYIALTDKDEFYTNSNAILKYRDKDKIKTKELEDLIFETKNQYCTPFFIGLIGIKASDNEENSKNYERILKEVEDIHFEYFNYNNQLTFDELMVNKLMDVSLVSNISDWLVYEYYSLNLQKKKI